MKNTKVVSITDRQRSLPLPCEHAQPGEKQHQDNPGLRYLLTRVSRLNGPPRLAIVEQVFELLHPMSDIEVLKEQTVWAKSK